MVERRSKEIAIRKTLGSSAFDVIYLLSSYFLKIIILAIVIASPLSYLLIGNWLDSFAYKISLDWWYFAIAGLLSVLMASFAVGAQIIRAARINPSQYLKE